MTWFGKDKGLEELLNSIPVIRNDEDSNIIDVFVLPLRPVNGTLHVGYVVNEQYKEVPISFKYRYGREHHFSLSADHERVNPVKDSVAFPLDVYDKAWKLPDDLATQDVREVHPLLVKDKDRVIVVFLHDPNYNYPVEMLLAEPGFPPPDRGMDEKDIDEAVRPVLEARRQYMFNT